MRSPQVETDPPLRGGEWLIAGGGTVTWSNDGLEYQCGECGTFVPASSVRCPHCGAEFDKEETVEELLEALTALLDDEVEDGEADQGVSTEEEPTKEVQEENDTPPERPDGNVRYKKVKRLLPNQDIIR
jgi:hypothetical protein